MSNDETRKAAYIERFKGALRQHRLKEWAEIARDVESHIREAVDYGKGADEVLASLADGRIVTGRQAVDNRLIDAIGGEAEAIAWLETDKGVAADLPVLTYYPPPDNDWFNLSRWLGDAARQSLGLNSTGPIALDGLVSLWQAAPAM